MRKWYSLIDKIYRKENLELTFKYVKKNNGAPGIDGEAVSNFHLNLELNIEYLHDKLKTNGYEPSLVRRVEIQKPDGGVKLLGIATVKDRAVQQAIINIIERIFDKTFHSSSYGYSNLMCVCNRHHNNIHNRKYEAVGEGLMSNEKGVLLLTIINAIIISVASMGGYEVISDPKAEKQKQS